MNGFHVKTKNERFTAAVSRFPQNFKNEHFAPSFGRLRWNIASKGVPYGAERLFSSFDQSYYWFVALSLPLPWSFVKFPIETTTAKALKRHKSHDWLDGEKQSSCTCNTHFISFLCKQQSGIVKCFDSNMALKQKKRFPSEPFLPNRANHFLNDTTISWMTRPHKLMALNIIVFK